MTSEDDKQREVVHRAAIGAFNRRALVGAKNLDRAYEIAGFGAGTTGEFICTCGRDDCDEVLRLPLEDYEFVQEKPYRFLAASGHATDVDDVILSRRMSTTWSRSSRSTAISQSRCLRREGASGGV